ncbi:hypothetical protein YC2023_059305 [Brassica napus]
MEFFKSKINIVIMCFSKIRLFPRTSPKNLPKMVQNHFCKKRVPTMLPSSIRFQSLRVIDLSALT